LGQTLTEIPNHPAREAQSRRVGKAERAHHPVSYKIAVVTTLRVFAFPTYLLPSLRAKRRVRHSPKGDGGNYPVPGRNSGLRRRFASRNDGQRAMISLGEAKAGYPGHRAGSPIAGLARQYRKSTEREPAGLRTAPADEVRASPAQSPCQL
jgi:hypothetical protein